MNRELFSDAMNEIDSKYVEEALTYKPAKRFVFPVWAQRCVAACLICVLGLGVVLAASPEARAEIQRWIETWRGSQVSYTYFGEAYPPLSDHRTAGGICRRAGPAL